MSRIYRLRLRSLNCTRAFVKVFYVIALTDIVTFRFDLELEFGVLVTGNNVVTPQFSVF